MRQGYAECQMGRKKQSKGLVSPSSMVCDSQEEARGGRGERERARESWECTMVGEARWEQETISEKMEDGRIKWFIAATGGLLRLLSRAYRCGAIDHPLIVASPFRWDRYTCTQPLFVLPPPTDTHATRRRAKEGLFLLQHGLSPYSGDAFKGSPAMLLVAMLDQLGGPLLVPLLFAFLEIGIGALILQQCDAVIRSAERFEPVAASAEMTPAETIPDETSRMVENLHTIPRPGPSSTARKSNSLSLIVLGLYMLNPVLVAEGASFSSQTLARFVLMLGFNAAQRGSIVCTAAAISLHWLWFDLSAVSLVVPVTLMLHQSKTTASQWMGAEQDELLDVKKRYHHVQFPFGLFMQLLGLMVFWSMIWLVCGAAISRDLLPGSLSFLAAAAKLQIGHSDLAPNVGTSWYLFQQVFPRFRGYFSVLWTFHPWIYVIPCTIRIGMFPEALTHLLASIFLMCGPYPTFCDLSLVMCLLLPHTKVLAYLNWKIMSFVVVAIWIPTLVMPVVLEQWLVAGTGNANFVYFQGLGFNVFVSLALVQFMAGAVKRRKAIMTAVKLRYPVPQED
ncbi:unnamed protein product [Chrysoparadoxa australica]